MLYCIDCRFADNRSDPPVEWAFKCMHPSSLREGETNLVTGQPDPSWQLTCKSARFDAIDKTKCGEAAQFWEPKAET